MLSSNTRRDAEIRSVLTADVVKFSLMDNHDQVRAMEMLIKFLHESIPQGYDKQGKRIWSPAGDGGSVTFNDILAAYETAVTLAKKVKEYNLEPNNRPHFEVRIGLHSGTVTIADDFDLQENVWGEGINLSARVMSLARPSQILASYDFVKRANLENKKDIAVDIGRWWAKHHKSIDLYNIYIDGVGLPPEEVDVWYGPFSNPLDEAIDTYKAMLGELIQLRERTFRVMVVCKRILDLAPDYLYAREVLENISNDKPGKNEKNEHLYHRFFSPMKPWSILHFFKNAVFKAYNKGECVVREGDVADSLMMVVSGEIAVSFKKSAQNLTDDQKNELTLESSTEKNVSLREGEIIGEMGLFSPGGRRTATLIAERKTVVLLLYYRFLDEDYYRTHFVIPLEPSAQKIISDPKPFKELVFIDDEVMEVRDIINSIRDIRNHIWVSYSRRIIENTICRYPFQHLPPRGRERLAVSGRFLPLEPAQNIELTQDFWSQYWMIIVDGTITARTRNNKTVVYECGQNFGLGLYSTGLRDQIVEVKVSEGSQIVCLNWDEILGLMNSSEFKQIYAQLAQEDLGRYSALGQEP